MSELGQRAVACKRWRWLPGMLTNDGYRVTYVDSYGWVFAVNIDGFEMSKRDTSIDSLPDLTDPATLGCLLHLVREVYVDELAHTTLPSDNDPYWTVWCGETYSEGPTEAEALVAALEEAP